MIEWREIPGFTSYKASTEGLIKTYNWKNKGVERIMKPAFDACGYLRTVLKRDSDGKKCTVKVHRIIAMTFIPNTEDKPIVNHINAVRDDNRVSNLEWCDKSYNCRHSFKLGISSNKGELNPCSKLTNKEVIRIRSEYTRGIKGGKVKGAITKPMLAEKYKVSAGTIKDIVSGKTWTHLL